VSASEVRDFFGSLNLRKAHKGIFITTSHFTTQAIQTAIDLGTRIVLIDGDELSSLFIKYNVGCRSVSLLEIKKIDEDFFENE